MSEGRLIHDRFSHLLGTKTHLSVEARVAYGFFRSNRPGYPHPMSSELENSGIRMAVGDCSVTERQRWRPPYKTDKTVHVHAKHYKHNEDGRTAPGVCGTGSVPPSHSGNVVTRIGIHTHTHTHTRQIGIGRTHGAPYRGYEYVPLRFGGTSLREWEHNNNNGNWNMDGRTAPRTAAVDTFR